MNQTILFTPVGGTDPISSTNCKDGSMLHICRFYKPNKVIMYMSKEMLDYQEEDDRYRYCLNNLAKKWMHYGQDRAAREIVYGRRGIRPDAK